VEGDDTERVPDGEELVALHHQLADARAEVERLQRAAANAVAEAAAQRAQTAAERYRDLVVRTEPSLPADLIAGSDVDAIDGSVTAAREIVGGVRSHIETQAQAGRVPAGAPPRSAPDLSALTPEQKIKHGLAARSS
jgi:multidrug resistance efflux pump